MRYLLKFEVPVEVGNAALADADFGEKMKDYLASIKAEAAYFNTQNGRRAGIIVVHMDDMSEMPAITEPLFRWLNAVMYVQPAMVIDDLIKARPAIDAAVKKYG